MNSKLIVIKIGGNVIDDSKTFHQFLKDFAAISGFKILVHGGGKAATKLAGELKIEAKMVQGRRITDIETLRIVTMVYAGLINKNIVAQLQSEGCNAIGLCGADANLIRAKKRPVLKASIQTGGGNPEETEAIDYGFAGDLDHKSVHADVLAGFLVNGNIPVFSAITHDGKGQLLNTNADTVASAIAVALADRYDTSLVYCFEKKGVLQDINDEHSVIEELNYEDFHSLKEQQLIAGGMLPKLHNAFEAIKNGVKTVYVGKADDLNQLDQQTFGTRLIE